MKEIVEKREVEELLGCEITDEQFEEALKYLSYGNMGETVMLFLSVCSENFQSRKMMCL